MLACTSYLDVELPDGAVISRQVVPELPLTSHRYYGDAQGKVFTASSSWERWADALVCVAIGCYGAAGAPRCSPALPQASILSQTTLSPSVLGSAALTFGYSFLSAMQAVFLYVNRIISNSNASVMLAGDARSSSTASPSEGERRGGKGERLTCK